MENSADQQITVHFLEAFFPHPLPNLWLGYGDQDVCLAEGNKGIGQLGACVGLLMSRSLENARGLPLHHLSSGAQILGVV